MVVAGVDCHKDTHTIVFIDQVGKHLGELTIPTTETGYAKAIKASRKHGKVHWGLEGTGYYGALFAQRLAASGETVYEVPGMYTKRHRSHGSRRGKSDPIDAKAVCEAVLREFERLPLYGFAMEQQAIRLRYDHRNRLVVERTRAVSRLRSAALRLGMDGLPKDMTTVRAVERMRCDLERVKTHDTVMVALLEELHDVLEDIERCNKRIGRVERQLRPLMGEVAPELLELKGVSTIGAAGLIGHSGDLRNCRDAAAFAMKSGTAPVQCSSGRNSSVRVNHGGNRQLNRILHTAAYMQVRDANTLGRTYYDRKRSEGKGHAAAFRALKRQLATVVFYRLKPCQGRLADAAARATA